MEYIVLSPSQHLWRLEVLMGSSYNVQCSQKRNPFKSNKIINFANRKALPLNLEKSQGHMPLEGGTVFWEDDFASLHFLYLYLVSVNVHCRWDMTEIESSSDPVQL